jgi:HPt (histidine-containing phosphotransfer) domain-containing protein
MTGNALAGDREKCLEAGMDDYISKPVRIGELQTVLERWGPTRSSKPDAGLLSQAPVLPKESLLDPAILAELQEMSPSGGVSIVRELVDMFLKSAPETIARINQFIDEPSKLSFHAHALRSMSLNLGAKRMVEIALKLEALARSGNLTEAPDLLRELEIAFNQTRVHLLPLREQ